MWFLSAPAVTVTLFINVLLFLLLQVLAVSVTWFVNVLLFQWTFSSQDIQGRFLQLCWEAAQQLYYFYSKFALLICSGTVIYMTRYMDCIDLQDIFISYYVIYKNVGIFVELKSSWITVASLQKVMIYMMLVMRFSCFLRDSLYLSPHTTDLNIVHETAICHNPLNSAN
jgi:hypothetical protein